MRASPGLRPPPVVTAERARQRNIRIPSVEPPGGQRSQKLGRPSCMQAAIPGLPSRAYGRKSRGGVIGHAAFLFFR